MNWTLTTPFTTKLQMNDSGLFALQVNKMAPTRNMCKLSQKLELPLEVKQNILHHHAGVQRVPLHTARHFRLEKQLKTFHKLST